MKIKNRPFSTLLILSGIFILLLNSCTTNNWPKFLGPESCMLIANTDLPEQWNDSTNLRWTQDMIGESWSSPVVYGDKLFYSTAVLVKEAPKKSETENFAGQPRPDEDESFKDAVYRWQLTCLDVKTGNELWTTVSYDGNPRIKKHAGSTYACETPVTDGKHIWVYYGMHGVYCYDLNGNLIWKQDPGAYSTLNGWGTGSSPVLFNNTLYVLVDNEENSFLIAYDAQTGDEKWKVDRDEKTTYSTPVIWKNSLRNELVTMGSKARSYNPETGELLWELTFNKGRAVASPVFDKELIYIGLSGGPRDIGPMHAVKAGASGDITPIDGQAGEFIAWSDTLAGLGNPSCVLYDGLLYILADRGGDVSCKNASNGETVYKAKSGKMAASWATPWIANGKLYFYDEKGSTQIIQTGKDFNVLGSNSLDDKFWASIAVADDAYIMKGVKQIYCVGK